MNSLKDLEVHVLNIDCGKQKDGKEYVRIQGFYPFNEKKKEKILSGEFGIIEIYDELTEEYGTICAQARFVDIIKFSGFYDNFKFKPVAITDIKYRKEK